MRYCRCKTVHSEGIDRKRADAIEHQLGDNLPANRSKLETVGRKPEYMD